jgi:hypothetical protein
MNEMKLDRCFCTGDAACLFGKGIVDVEQLLDAVHDFGLGGIDIAVAEDEVAAVGKYTIFHVGRGAEGAKRQHFAEALLLEHAHEFVDDALEIILAEALQHLRLVGGAVEVEDLLIGDHAVGSDHSQQKAHESLLTVERDRLGLAASKHIAK